MEPTHSTQIQKPRVGAKEFFLYAGFFAVLYTLIGTFINFSFAIINSLFPDRQNTYYDVYGSGMRFSVSMLIILTPILLFLLKKIYQELRAHPLTKDIWVRKWGLYATLTLTIITLVTDLVLVLYTFLGGEISARFVWKAVIVLILSVALWLYTRAELQDTLTPQPAKTRALGWIMLVLMVASISTGFYFIGSPTFLRNVKDDNQRESDLSNIRYQVVNHYQSKGQLPATLEEINVGDPYAYKIPVDPATDAVYEYKVLPSTMVNGISFPTFSLCATFEEDGEADNKIQNGFGNTGARVAVPSMPYPDYYGGEKEQVIDFDDHPEGNKCFDINIDPARYKVYNPSPVR